MESLLFLILSDLRRGGLLILFCLLDSLQVVWSVELSNGSVSIHNAIEILS